jgi:hypothetical protein
MAQLIEVPRQVVEFGELKNNIIYKIYIYIYIYSIIRHDE